MLHYAGEVWAPVAGMNPSDQYLDIWGTGSKDIYVVGFAWENSLLSGQGVVLHYDGTSWSRELPGAALPLAGLWGDDSGNVFAAGFQGTILKRTAR